MSPLGWAIISVGWLNGPAARSASQLVTLPVSECRPRVPSSNSTLPSSVNDLQAVRVGNLAAAPGAQVLALAVEHHDRGILALEHVDPILRIGRDPAGQPKGLSGG